MEFARARTRVCVHVYRSKNKMFSLSLVIMYNSISHISHILFDEELNIAKPFVLSKHLSLVVYMSMRANTC